MQEKSTFATFWIWLFIFVIFIIINIIIFTAFADVTPISSTTIVVIFCSFSIKALILIIEIFFILRSKD